MQAICLWSGPRNVSTALMYSFAQRSDTRVVDEPLYGHYLKASGAAHPGRDDVIAAMNCDGNSAIRELLQPAVAPDRPLLFMKHMAHHLTGINLDFMDRTQNIFLVRDPREMLPSLTIQLPNATLADTGLAVQSALFEMLQKHGSQPAVIDSRQLLLDPQRVLTELCHHLEIPFESKMLSWPKGPIPEDGIWAKHWYHAVHNSTGFSRYRPKNNFPPALEGLLQECKPHYDMLFSHAIRATTGD
ncbi:MAG: sulfotransferase family protein [Gammaproteobacteria bacterium]|nr:sulfotransferase family protein [Gammaproteobacteria bacterium]MDH4313445.1 sulfotransferase family protein [Gammaproteobacteria bacterium]MDH5213021.1 sulfotransferase family protein [Gammaproteobacteria bacterium]MDH5500995.1 sulfotransferase family protein [Gammaproteobacteria bacterium]